MLYNAFVHPQRLQGLFPGHLAPFLERLDTGSACHCVCPQAYSDGTVLNRELPCSTNVRTWCDYFGWSQPMLYRAERPFFDSLNAKSGWPNPNASEDLQLVPLHLRHTETNSSSCMGKQSHNEGRMRRRCSWTTYGWHFSSLKPYGSPEVKQNVSSASGDSMIEFRSEQHWQYWFLPCLVSQKCDQ